MMACMILILRQAFRRRMGTFKRLCTSRDRRDAREMAALVPP